MRSGRFSLFRIGVPAELEVDAPDVVGLPMQQRRLVAMKRRVEPEAALGRKAGAHQNVGDQEPIVEDLSFAFEPEHVANRAARAVGGDQPVGMHRVFAIGCADAKRDAVGFLFDADDFAAPAQLGLRELAQALDQELLDPVLLQVDERRPAVTLAGQQVEFVDLLVAKENPADAPADALLHQPLGAAQAVENLERALRPADRARADADRVVLVDQQHVDAAQREIDRRGQADRAGAGDDHRPVSRRPAQLGGPDVRVDRMGIGLQRDGESAPNLPATPTSPCRAARSRCADRGTGSLRRRRASRRTAGSGRK